MGLVLSIDLASKLYSDFGFCLLQESQGAIVDISFPSLHDFCLMGSPDPVSFASATNEFCIKHKVSILMLDGPQGWKDPGNDMCMRTCEKHVNAMGKTGRRGQVKPKPFTSFVCFSTKVFYYLNQVDKFSLVKNREISFLHGEKLLVETYPRSAWESLKIKPLPSKKKHKEEDIMYNWAELSRRFHLPKTKKPTHDELCALVSGLAGVAISAGDESGYIALGSPPLDGGGHLLEGYIINPR